MKLLEPRRIRHIESYMRHFDYVGEHNGFAFDCDKDGNLLSTVTDGARANFAACLDGTHKVIDRGVQDYSRDYVQEAVKQCECDGKAYQSRSCGVFICDRCGSHEGLARCFCGWSASGGNGYNELLEMGERIEDDY